MPNLSRALKLKTLTILLRDPDAIDVVAQRAKRERRSKSAALAVIVLEWAEFKSMIRLHHAAARRSKSLPENGQDTGAAVGGQAENSAAAGDGKEADNGE